MLEDSSWHDTSLGHVGSRDWSNINASGVPLQGLGSLQWLQPSLKSGLPCDWPQVRPLQLIQHSIDIAACRFIGEQFAIDDRLLWKQQPVENTSCWCNMWSAQPMPEPHIEALFRGIACLKSAPYPSALAALPFYQDSIHGLNRQLLAHYWTHDFIYNCGWSPQHVIFCRRLILIL